MLSLRVVEEIDSSSHTASAIRGPCSSPTGVQVVGEPRVVGEQQEPSPAPVSAGRRLLKAIGWNLAERGKALRAGSVCSVAFHPSINEWNDRREVQLEIRDFALETPENPIDRRLEPAASGMSSESM